MSEEHKPEPPSELLIAMVENLRVELKKMGFDDLVVMAIKKLGNGKADHFLSAQCSAEAFGNMLLVTLVRQMTTQDAAGVVNMLISHPALLAHMGAPPAQLAPQQPTEASKKALPQKKDWVN